jgi:hypothetical protein
MYFEYTLNKQEKIFNKYKVSAKLFYTYLYNVLQHNDCKNPIEIKNFPKNDEWEFFGNDEFILAVFRPIKTEKKIDKIYCKYYVFKDNKSFVEFLDINKNNFELETVIKIK